MGPQQERNADSPKPAETESTTTIPVPVLTATPEQCYHCFDTLLHTLLPQLGIVPLPIDVDPNVHCPLFVTWEIRKTPSGPWHLRGCIGTLAPAPVATSIGAYAVTSSQRDRRFEPVQYKDIPNLRVAVSLLVHYEPCRDVWDWTVGVHGIMIRFEVRGRSYNATFLPEVAMEQGWDAKNTVDSLIRKAGYHAGIDKDLYAAVQCTRYQSSKCRVSYEEYVRYHCNGRDPLQNPSISPIASTFGGRGGAQAACTYM